ncbi:MAG: RidA family protein [Dongia sp.]|jgi:reactive intermediate/imine deaminase
MANDKIIAIGKKNPNLPFHPAVRAGDFIFVSGQVPKDENGNMCGDATIEVQTRWTLEAIKRVLAEAGAEMSDVVKVVTYIEDARNFSRYNGVFKEYFPEGKLARTTVECRLAIDCMIEMDAVAYKPKG